jgi:hypothetical protein
MSTSLDLNAYVNAWREVSPILEATLTGLQNLDSAAKPSIGFHRMQCHPLHGMEVKNSCLPHRAILVRLLLPLYCGS